MDSSPEYLIAKVTAVHEPTQHNVAGTTVFDKTFDAVIEDGGRAGEQVTVEQSDLTVANQALNITQDERVVLERTSSENGQAQYALVDVYRVPQLMWSVIGFFLLALIFGRWRGFTSLLGLLASAIMIVGYFIPQVIAGTDPLKASLVTACGVTVVSLFLAHGFNRRTAIAFAGTVITLFISAFLAVHVVSFTHLFGTGTEESLYVVAGIPRFHIQNLLLAGIILGLLGVLDDITTGQSAIVEELHDANPSFGFRELYRRGLSVGREHIASLINTLFLAYAGISLPLFILFWLGHEGPWWMIFNSELIAEEIARTVVGSSCLILAVPITTAIAAWWWGRQPQRHREHQVS